MAENERPILPDRDLLQPPTAVVPLPGHASIMRASELSHEQIANLSDVLKALKKYLKDIDNPPLSAAEIVAFNAV